MRDSTHYNNPPDAPQPSVHRTGATPGDISELYRLIALAPQLKPRVRTIIAQPGLSVQAATTEHLRVIAGAESYVRIVTAGTFEFYCHT